MTAWDDLEGAAPPALLRARLLDDAEEVLVLTYTCDLSFFEDVCLREARSVRARATVLFDADRLTAGPGRPGPADYLAVPVVCKGGGAFHPKLVVIASESDAVVAIGSGNATTSGWHHNAELWTVLHGSGPTVPRLFHSLAGWLSRLPEAVWMEDVGRERLARVAELLTARPVQEHPGEPVLVTTDAAPIIEQLPVPDSPVTELAVAAPFFDPKAGALARLLARFQPDQVRLLLTQDVQCDVDAVAEALEQAPAAIVGRPETRRYHHGKIVEWWTADAGWALTGSANCSKAAMTETMAAGGNCELGLLCRLDTSVIDLVPSVDVDLLDPVALDVRDPDPERTPSAPLRVLGVRIIGGRVEATALVGRGQVPEWLAVGDLRLDHDRSRGQLHTYAADADSDWVSTLTLASALVTTDTGIKLGAALVTDVGAALARIDKPSPLEHTPLHELITDPAHLAALVEALNHLATVRPDRIPATQPGTARRRRIEERISTAVGPALLRFALGLDPAARDSAIADDELTEDPEQPETTSQAQALPATQPRPGTVTTVVDALTDAQRARLRRDIEKLLDASSGWPLPAKFAVFRVVLLVVAAGLWRTPEDSANVLCQALFDLWGTDQEQTLDHEHAALATIGMVALHRGLALCAVPDPEVVEAFELLRQSYGEWTDWLKAAPEDVVRHYVTGLSGHTLGVLFERISFTDELDWIIGRSALHEAVDRIPDARIDADSVVRVATSKDARRVTLAVLDELREFPDVHVIAVGATEVHGWWDRRRLLLVTRSGPTWRAEVWSHLPTGIASYARGTPLRLADHRWTTTDPDVAFVQERSRR